MPNPPPPSKLCTTESESIGREFIDNWSHYISLLETNTEKDILQLLDLLETVQSQWQQSEAAAKHYKQKLETSEQNFKEAIKEQKKLKDLYLNCQTQLNRVSNSKEDIEEELKEYKNLWEKLKNIIKDSDQAFISDGLLSIINKVQKCRSVSGRRNVAIRDVTTKTQYSNEETDEISVFESGPSEIDYDKTGDTSMESSTPKRATRKRCSATSKTPQQPLIVRFDDAEEDDAEEIPTKRCKNIEEDIKITATIRYDSSEIRHSSGYVKIRRSKSESDLCRFQKEIINIKPKPITPHFNAGSRFSMNKQTPQNYARSWTLGQEIERRTHRVKSFSSVFENCDVCSKHLIAKNALKCVDCNVRFHRHCQSGAPMPCIPKVPIPKTPSKLQKCSLVQYCPETHPFIPPILIHCIIALERDRLSFEGIYRISGTQEAVKSLYKEFMSNRKIPNLFKAETENITGCIKMFLRELRDSIIPSTSYNDFLKAIEAKNEQQIINTIFELSAPNRDTLAYLILHLQKVANNSSINKMPIQNLATVLCPTIVGYSKLVTPSFENVEELSRSQYIILYRLLKIPSEFWKRFIENNMGAVLAAEARTPGSQTPLLTVTSTTKTQTSSSTSKNGTPKMPKPKSNNNQFHLEFEDTNLNTENFSPIIQPLSMASKTMRGISFKPPM